jgi:hypothetical protein
MVVPRYLVIPRVFRACSHKGTAKSSSQKSRLSGKYSPLRGNREFRGIPNP